MTVSCGYMTLYHESIYRLKYEASWKITQDLKVKMLSFDKFDLNFVWSSVNLEMMSRSNCSQGIGKDSHWYIERMLLSKAIK